MRAPQETDKFQFASKILSLLTLTKANLDYKVAVNLNALRANLYNGGIDMEIKQILSSDLSDVIKLVTDVFMKFEAPDYSQDGIKAFFDTALHNEEFMSNLKIYGAYINEQLVGVIATRNDGNHIALFFVDGNHHKQGIGRNLFNIVLQNSTSNELTVNSSPYAKEVYHRLGFEDTDVEQIVMGIRFIPMTYTK